MAKVIKDRVTGLSKGYGFVKYSDIPRSKSNIASTTTNTEAQAQQSYPNNINAPPAQSPSQSSNVYGTTTTPNTQTTYPYSSYYIVPATTPWSLNLSADQTC
ncbi:unnamed protein product [Lactuca virosa]|uniref:RRM domain-containing protein n=1 Tax=Lactuca virosa TaxID=75947 RepID=A0AAU9MRM1_9ASTR|nr:unnamed protein product [Lactuca virosa]